MNIKEMHDLFRVVGQQVGMQLVRGILPAHIDSFINIEINETIKNELLINANTVLPDSVNLQSITLNPINAFRTLYRKDVFEVANKDYFSIIDNHYKFILPNETNVKHGTGNIANITNKINSMLYLGFNIQYEGVNKFTSCRLIGASVLESTLKDFCNGADKENPISVLMGETDTYNGTSYNKEYVEFYTNSITDKINKISVSYIKNPNIVKWDNDDTKCVNCDLPEYMHYNIVNGAVNRYLLSINSQPTTSNNVKNNN